jgi:ABC-2 type transport system ATP-binding protein
MKRRVLVAQALVHRPPVIVLDEPTAGVDVELRHGLWQFIRRLNGEGHTIILTTHYLEEAESLCGRIAMLKQGRIVTVDSTQALLKRVSCHALSFRLAAGELPPSLRVRAEVDGRGTWRITFDHYDEIEPILGSLRQARLVLEEFRVESPDLEDVFVQAMREASR